VLLGVLDAYKPIFNPAKMKDMYEHLPEISDDIAKQLPLIIIPYDEAEEETYKDFDAVYVGPH